MHIDYFTLIDNDNDQYYDSSKRLLFIKYFFICMIKSDLEHNCIMAQSILSLNIYLS